MGRLEGAGSKDGGLNRRWPQDAGSGLTTGPDAFVCRVCSLRSGTFPACVPHLISTLFEGQDLCGPVGDGKVGKGKSSKITLVTHSREKGLGFLSLFPLFGKVRELFSFPSFPSRRGFETFWVTK
jgi:hypothetical protein